MRQRDFVWLKERKKNVFEMYLNVSWCIWLIFRTQKCSRSRYVQIRPKLVQKPSKRIGLYHLFIVIWAMVLEIDYYFWFCMSFASRWFNFCKKNASCCTQMRKKRLLTKTKRPEDRGVFFHRPSFWHIFTSGHTAYVSNTNRKHQNCWGKNNGPLQIAFTPTVCLPIPKRSIYPSTDLT